MDNLSSNMTLTTSNSTTPESNLPSLVLLHSIYILAVLCMSLLISYIQSKLAGHRIIVDDQYIEVYITQLILFTNNVVAITVKELFGMHAVFASIFAFLFAFLCYVMALQFLGIAVMRIIIWRNKFFIVENAFGTDQDILRVLRGIAVGLGFTITSAAQFSGYTPPLYFYLSDTVPAPGLGTWIGILLFTGIALLIALLLIILSCMKRFSPQTTSRNAVTTVETAIAITIVVTAGLLTVIAGFKAFSGNVVILNNCQGFFLLEVLAPSLIMVRSREKLSFLRRRCQWGVMFLRAVFMDQRKARNKPIGTVSAVVAEGFQMSAVRVEKVEVRIEEDLQVEDVEEVTSVTQVEVHIEEEEHHI